MYNKIIAVLFQNKPRQQKKFVYEIAYHVKYKASGSHSCCCPRNTLNIFLLESNKSAFY